MGECSMTTETETHQGWANRETWAMNLHLSNDKRFYDLACEAAAFGVEKAIGHLGAEVFAENALPVDWLHNGPVTNFVAMELEKICGFLQEELEGTCSLCGSEVNEQRTHLLRLMFTDVGSVWRVDWLQMAPHWIESIEDRIPDIKERLFANG